MKTYLLLLIRGDGCLDDCISIHLSIHPSIHNFLHITIQSINPYIHSSIYPYIHLTGYLFIHVYLHIHLSIYTYIHTIHLTIRYLCLRCWSSYVFSHWHQEAYEHLDTMDWGDADWVVMSASLRLISWYNRWRRLSGYVYYPVTNIMIQ